MKCLFVEGKIPIFFTIFTIFVICLSNNGTVPSWFDNYREQQTATCDRRIEFDLSILVFVKPDKEQMKNLVTKLLPSLALFWPHEESALTLIMITDVDAVESGFDKEMEANARKILPQSASIEVKITGDEIERKHKLGYVWSERNKQLPKFWSENFTTSEYVGILDADTLFVTPIMPDDLFVDGKPVVRGTYAKSRPGFMKQWSDTTEILTGRSYLLNFMDYFPVIVKSDHFQLVREHVIKTRQNGTTFDETFDNFAHQYKMVFTEFTVIAHYLWYFKHDEYYWIAQKTRNNGRYYYIEDNGDELLSRYLQRLVPSISTHYKTVKNLHSTEKQVMLQGICYADISMRHLCNLTLDSDYYDKVNVNQWIFEGDENWSVIDPEKALKAHREHMGKRLECRFHWRQDLVKQISI